MLPSLNTPQVYKTASSEAAFTDVKQSKVDEAQVRKAAQDFEAAYIAQMLTFSGLDKALMAGGGEDMAAFTSFYIESFAEQIAEKGGFGLADNFYDRMLKLSGLDMDMETNNVNFGKL